MASRSRRSRHEFGSVRTGRASPALLDRIMVDYYGALTPLKQLATITAPEARLLTIQPYDKSSIKAIERAILESDVGLTPSNDGNADPPGHPRADRGAPPAAGQGRAPHRRGGPGRDPQHPPRRHARPARAQGGGGGRLRRRAPSRGRAAEGDRCEDHRARRAAEAQGSRDPRGRECARQCAAGTDGDGARARYVAIITDGNGRWAQRRGLPAIAGHEAGADTVKARLRDAVDLGIEELTVYSFSTENWVAAAGGGRGR